MPGKKGQKKSVVTPAEQASLREARKQRRRAKRAQKRLQAQQSQQAAHLRVQKAFGPNWGDNSQGAVLARQMAIPESSTAPVRMPTTDMPKTAVTKLTTTLSVKNPVITLANQPSGSPPFTNGDLMFYIYGLPGFSMMYGPVVGSTTVVDATVTSFAYSSSPGSRHPLTTTTLQPGSSVSSHWLPTKCTDSESGAVRPLGVAVGQTYAWFDRTEKFHYKVYSGNDVATTISGPITVELVKWMGPGEPPKSIATLSYKKGDSGTFAYTVPESGWYSMEFTMSAVDTDTLITTFSVEVTAAAAVANPARYKLCYQDALQNKDVGESIRRTGFSVLITNTTAQINRQGNVVAARLVADGYYDEDFSLGVNHLDAASDKYTGDASNGVYTYMDFDQSAERFYQAHSGAVSTQALGPVFDLEYYGYIHVIKISNPTPETAANSFLVTITGIYEFRSDSMLYAKGVPMASNLALTDARRINNSTDYFYENPLHMSDIWRYIKNAFGQVRRAAIPLGMAASTMFPEAAGAIMPVAHALQV